MGVPVMRARFALAAATLAAATLFSADPMAYVLSGPTWSQAQTAYRINTANLDLPALSVETAVRSGADTWEQQSAAFRFVYSGPSSQTTNTNDGINLVMFRNASSGSAIATTYWWSSGSRIIDADIVFWDANFQFVTGSSGCSGSFFIEDIATHEFGHALGLGHSTVATATMYPSISTCSQQSRTLDADDIAGVRSLYPPTATPPTPPTSLRIIK
jgi:poly(3-hydroxybutyrate) depolymerase